MQEKIYNMAKNCVICGKQLNNFYASHCRFHKIMTKEWCDAISKGKLKSNPGYRAIHYWVVKNLGKPSKCSKCKKEFKGHKIHWANISRTYKRDLTDWIRLCSKCHGAFDTGHKQSRKVKI